MTRILAILIVIFGTACCTTATVPSDTSRLTSIYSCDGSDTTFTWSFGLDDDDDLQVILIDSSGAETVLTKTTDYTMASANSNDPQDWSSGGTVTTVQTYSSSYTILLRSNTARTQTTDIDDEDVEETADKLTYIVQDIYEVLSRCLKIQPSESGDTVLFDPDGSAGYAYRDATGDWALAATVSSTQTIASDWSDLLDGTTTTLSNGRTVRDQLGRPYINVKTDYGAAGDGVTDDSAAIQAAIDAVETAGGGIVYLPVGTYITSGLTLTATVSPTTGAHPILQGVSMTGTRLKAADANDIILQFTGTGHVTSNWEIRDLCFDGKADGVLRSADGLYMGDGVSDYQGSVRCSNVLFYGCDRGYKSEGCYDAAFQNCSWWSNDIGILIDDANGQHGGCQRFYNCQSSWNYTFACLKGGSQIEFHGGRFENNNGFIFFVNGATAGAYPLMIDHVWMEGTPRVATVDVDGVSYDTGYGGKTYPMWFEDAGQVVIRDTVAYSAEVRGETWVKYDDCTFYNWYDANMPDSNSVVTATNCQVGSSSDTYSYASDVLAPGAVLQTTSSDEWRWVSARTDVSGLLCYDYENLIGSGSCAVSFTPEGAHTNTYSFVTDANAPIYGTCLKLELEPNQTSSDGVYLWIDNPVLSAGKWYYFSLDVKADGEDGWVNFGLFNTSGGYTVRLDSHPTSPDTYGKGMRITTDRWRRYTQLVSPQADRPSRYWRFWNSQLTADPNVLIADAQLIEFDTAQEAYEFAQRNAFCPENTLQRGSFVDPITVRNGSTSAGYLRLYEDSDNGSNYVQLSGPASTSNITLTLPSSDGNADELLKTDGSGMLSWTAAGTGDMLAATYDADGDSVVDGNDTAFAAAWNGDDSAPTMNAVYDWAIQVDTDADGEVDALDDDVTLADGTQVGDDGEPNIVFDETNNYLALRDTTDIYVGTTKTVIKTIDVDDDASTDDYQFDDDAANQTEQVITLTNILPAYAELVSCQLRCFETVEGSSSMSISVGTTSGGNEILSAANTDSANDINTTAAAAGPELGATNAARSVYVNATPGVNWSLLDEGRWAIMLTYIDYGAIYTTESP